MLQTPLSTSLCQVYVQILNHLHMNIPDASIVGLNVSQIMVEQSSEKMFHTPIPSAAPAAMAAPNAVVSAIDGLTVLMPKMSACSCIKPSFAVIPPSTCKEDNGTPPS